MLKQWSKYEILWLISSTLLILSLNLFWNAGLFSTISAVAGVISVVLCAKGKISYIYFGVIQASIYGYLAWFEYNLVGEGMLNLLFFVPVTIITWFLWKRNVKREDKVNGEDVVTKRLSKLQWLILLPLMVVAYLLYVTLLNSLNASMVGLDALAVVLSVVAQFLLTFRYAEQWLFWIIINVLTVVLWVVVLFQTGGNDYGILVMFCAFLINSIYGYVNWLKISKVGNSN